MHTFGRGDPVTYIEEITTARGKSSARMSLVAISVLCLVEYHGR